MGSHYQTLRIQPDKDIAGKSEADIIKKIENNFKALVARAPQMYPAADVREKALKEMEEAKAVLSDPQKRMEYDKQLKEALKQMQDGQVTIELIQLDDEEIEKMNQENEQEQGGER